MKTIFAVLLILSTGLLAVAQEPATSTDVRQGTEGSNPAPCLVRARQTTYRCGPVQPTSRVALGAVVPMPMSPLVW
jgi:hypothetical protein